jgi:RNA 2',3'-cyclic 3'-phosphodiesterase
LASNKKLIEVFLRDLNDLKRIRSFIALEINNKGALEKLQLELSEVPYLRHHEAKPVKRENLHFTVIFLDELDLPTIEKIKNQLSELTFQPIKITYRGLGAFPNPNFANVIWVGIEEEGKNKIISLADSVVSKLKEIGFKPDKPFTPHMTIFRAKKERLRVNEVLSKFGTKSLGDDVIRKLSLKSSNLTPQGPIYSDIFVVHAE